MGEFLKGRSTVQLAVFAILILAGTSALAEDWLCTEASSQRSGNVVRSCGIGLGNDENAARRDAFDNAKTEFSALCGASADCDGHAVNVYPERTNCTPQGGGGFKCYRLLVFTITEQLAEREAIAEMPQPIVNVLRMERLMPKAEPPVEAPPVVEPAPITAPPEPPVERVAEERPMAVPFRLTPGVKIKVGMTKAEALEKFGKPDIVLENAQNVAVFYRGRKFCYGIACMFRFERETGLVTTYQDFRIEFTEALN